MTGARKKPGRPQRLVPGTQAQWAIIIVFLTESDKT